MPSNFEYLVATKKPESKELLSEGKVGAYLVTYPGGARAIMKIASLVSPKKGKTAPYGIPVRQLPYNEVAFYQLAKTLGFDEVVPETVLGEYEGETASFQQYVHSKKLYEINPKLQKVDDEDAWVVSFRETLRDFPKQDVLRLTLLDFLVCQRDRHAANYGARLDVSSGSAQWRLVGWDNGTSFGPCLSRYHCVAHKYIFRYAFDLSSVWTKLENIRREELQDALSGLVNGIEHVWLRLQFLLEYPHRMPWSVLSQGAEGPKDFPSYERFFDDVCRDKDPTLYILQHANSLS